MAEVTSAGRINSLDMVQTGYLQMMRRKRL